VGPDTLVGIAAHRSLEMVVGLLGILKAGGAYVPLDPDYPADRLAFMLEDSRVGLLLTQEHLLRLLPATAVQVICLDRNQEGPAEDPADQGTSQDLVYCLYTSGTTGRPKGAGNTHAALCNRLQWMQREYRLTPADRVLQKTPFSFDVSAWELFWPLMEGAVLVMAPPGAHRDPAALRRLIVDRGVTVLHFVPSMLQAFMAVEDIGACTSLRAVVCSGEALGAELAQRFLASSQAGLHNLYGPTEAAIDVSHWACRVEPDRAAVPIGRPLANIRLHVLDQYLCPVAVGVQGELFIGGIGLARGYHRRPGLTAERFVPDPFGTGERLYRTGDLARWRADGVLEYAGRIDQQVKIRGFRIEPGEIEARLLEHPAVRAAAVVAAQGPAGQRLVAYVAAEEDGGLAAALQDRLRAILPDYMVPAQLVVLESLPLSPNGKLDRKALPRAEPPAGPTRTPPATAAERILTSIWQELLGRTGIAVDDNFFELGGDSILTIQVVSRARQAGLRLSPRDLFQHQTLRAGPGRHARGCTRGRAGAGHGAATPHPVPGPLPGNRDPEPAALEPSPSAGACGAARDPEAAAGADGAPRGARRIAAPLRPRRGWALAGPACRPGGAARSPLGEAGGGSGGACRDLCRGTAQPRPRGRAASARRPGRLPGRQPASAPRHPPSRRRRGVLADPAGGPERHLSRGAVGKDHLAPGLDGAPAPAGAGAGRAGAARLVEHCARGS
jgi:amino acid adenylation domain-containing protein